MITRITALRETKSAGLWHDDKRKVTEEGKVLARRMGEELGDAKYDIVIHSPHTCSLETAALLLGTEDFRSEKVGGLFPFDSDWRFDVLRKVHAQIEDQSLKAYFEIEECRRALYSVGGQAGDEIDRIITDYQAYEVLIVGPDLFLPAALYSMAEQEKVFAHRELGECEGWIFTFDTTRCGVSDVRVRLVLRNRSHPFQFWTYVLYVQVGEFGVGLYERLAGRHIGTHEDIEDSICFPGVVNRNLL